MQHKTDAALDIHNIVHHVVDTVKLAMCSGFDHW